MPMGTKKRYLEKNDLILGNVPITFNVNRGPYPLVMREGWKEIGRKKDTRSIR